MEMNPDCARIQAVSIAQAVAVVIVKGKIPVGPWMDTVCISKSDFNKLAKTIDNSMQIRSNSSLF